jgi:DNA repair exonuclease SbcCD ATPase subunit
VGIISHVEEMKSEIRTYLSVTNSSQTGSKIQPSWEKKKN